MAKIRGDDEVQEAHQDGGNDAPQAQRLDKWLWFARMAKTRSLAQRLIEEGRVRVNRERIVKSAQTIRPGDLVSVQIGERLRLLEVRSPGLRRGPASQAELLYRDLAPPAPRSAEEGAPTSVPRPALPRRDQGTGRPTKLDRRRTDRLRDR